MNLFYTGEGRGGGSKEFPEHEQHPRLETFCDIKLEILINIARIANAVQCHSQLSGDKDCNAFSFSNVRIVSVSNVSSH